MTDLAEENEGRNTEEMHSEDATQDREISRRD